MTILLKRAYDTPSRSDGCRILVERLWPRGVSKQHAKIDLWLKEAAPSTELRLWFNHDAFADDPDHLARFHRAVAVLLSPEQLEGGDGMLPGLAALVLAGGCLGAFLVYGHPMGAGLLSATANFGLGIGCGVFLAEALHGWYRARGRQRRSADDALGRVRRYQDPK